MQLRHRQRGLGWFGMFLVLAGIGFVALVGMKTFPIYMNQMKIASAVTKVATDPGMGDQEAQAVRAALQRLWDVDDIGHLQPRDIKLKRTEHGRFLVYDYEARTPLFYNISLVIHFQDEVRMTALSS